MIGEGVGEVVASSDPAMPVGETVRGYFGWQQYAVAATGELERIDRNAAPLSTALGVLGMPGLTAYYGLLEVGQPQAGETVVVTGRPARWAARLGRLPRSRAAAWWVFAARRPSADTSLTTWDSTPL